jgi:hypothetical protein
MRFLVQVILTSILSYILQQFIAPWIVVPVAMLIALMTQNNASAAFLGGFAAISLLWMVKATVIDVYTNSILSAKVAPLLGLKSPIMLILLTGLVGGLLGGLGAASGQHMLYMLKKKHRSVYRV